MSLGSPSILWVWFLSISAQAQPLVGPDGPIQIGVSSHPEYPFYPSINDSFYGYESVWVDAESGALQIVAEESSGKLRQYSDSVWSLPEEIEGVDYQYTKERLTAVLDRRGARWGYSYDSENRIREIRWPNGGVVRVRYNNAGQVNQLLGPSSERLTLEWGTDLKIRWSNGKSYQVKYFNSDTTRGYRIQDNLGRRLELEKAKEVWKIRDSRGLQTIIKGGEGELEIQDVQGGVWRASIEDDVLTQLQGTSGRWEWMRSDDILRIRGPGGVSQSNRYDDNNRVVEQSMGSSVRRYSYSTEGYLREIRDSIGHSIYFGYDQNGQIRRLEDASGGAFILQRDSTGAVVEITGRAKQKWRIERDVMGRVKTIITPEGLTFGLQRNLRGEVIAVEEAFIGAWKIDRDANGRPSRVTLPQGNSFLFDHDNQGRVRRAVMPDKSQFTYTYDRMGWLRTASFNGQGSSIVRDVLGRVQQWGEHRISYDTLGNITNIDGWLRFGRTATGALSSVKVDGYELNIGRDPQGLPVTWTDDNGQFEVTRDRNGRIIKARSGFENQTQVETQVLRDPRGWVISAGQAELSWRYLRSSSGVLLKAVMSSGPSLGFERDAAMNLNWIRYPGGQIQRFDWNAREANVQLWSAAGVLMMDQQFDFDDQCRIDELNDKKGAEQIYERDWYGGIQQITSGGTLLFQQTDRQVMSRNGTIITYGIEGEAQSAIVSPPFQPYGADITSWTYQRDQYGDIAVFDGQIGAWFVERDPLGRLSQICSSDNCWQFQYSPLGHLVAFLDPNGFWKPIVWQADAADQVYSDTTLIMLGAAQFLSLDGQILVSSEFERTKSLIYDIQGSLIWVGEEDKDTRLSNSHTSLQHGYDGALGQSCGFQPVASGPFFCGPLSYDSISGDALSSNRLNWISQYHPAFEQPENPSLNLALQLGLLPYPESHSWMPRDRPTAVQWVSPQFDKETRVLGNSIGALDVHFKPIEWWLVEHLLEAKPDPTSAEVVAHFLSAEPSLGQLQIWPLSNVFWWQREDIFYPGLAYFSEMDKNTPIVWWE